MTVSGVGNGDSKYYQVSQQEKKASLAFGNDYTIIKTDFKGSKQNAALKLAQDIYDKVNGDKTYLIGGDPSKTASKAYIVSTILETRNKVLQNLQNKINNLNFIQKFFGVGEKLEAYTAQVRKKFDESLNTLTLKDPNAVKEGAADFLRSENANNFAASFAKAPQKEEKLSLGEKAKAIASNFFGKNKPSEEVKQESASNNEEIDWGTEEVQVLGGESAKKARAALRVKKEEVVQESTEEGLSPREARQQAKAEKAKHQENIHKLIVRANQTLAKSSATEEKAGDLEGAGKDFYETAAQFKVDDKTKKEAIDRSKTTWGQALNRLNGFDPKAIDKFKNDLGMK